MIDGTNGANQVSGEDIDANCTVDVSLDDFTSMLNGDLNPMGAFMSGKMKVKGDTGVALKLQTLLARFFLSKTEKNVVVIGAGPAGAAVAYYLQKRGMK